MKFLSIKLIVFLSFWQGKPVSRPVDHSQISARACGVYRMGSHVASHPGLFLSSFISQLWRKILQGCEVNLGKEDLPGYESRDRSFAFFLIITYLEVS